MLLVSCATPIDRYPRHALSDQILRPRPGFKGLTNRACETWDEKSACTSYVTVDHDLADATFREATNRLNFVCNVGGARYKICKDEPGLCRISYEKKCFLFFCKEGPQKVEYLPASNYQFWLDANVECFNREAYPSKDGDI